MKSENSLKIMKKFFPILDRFKDTKLAITVSKIWIEIWENSKWEKLEEAPWRIICPGINLIDHTNNVAKEAFNFAQVRNEVIDEKIDTDILLAGALLHDVGILLELEPAENNSVVESKRGSLFQHGFIGACSAFIDDIPDEVVHIIICHTRKSRVIPKTREAIILHYVDSADADLYAYSLGAPLLLEEHK
jgi:hypothetical protein